jgi:hypothetical protein
LRANKFQNHSLCRSSLTDDARYQIWKSCTEKSAPWQAKKQPAEAQNTVAQAFAAQPLEDDGGGIETLWIGTTEQVTLLYV